MLEGLHDVIQTVMGWADYHLHHFQFGDLIYGVSAPDDPEMNDGSKVKLWTMLDDGERVFLYLYDYGDGWCCVVVLEAVAPAIRGVAYPRLVEGARRGPPEDIGGPYGYREFLEAIADPKHERHTELLERFVSNQSAAVRYRCDQSQSCLACAPQDHPPQGRQAGRHRLRR